VDRSYRYDIRPAERARDLTRMVEIERACFPEKLAYLRSEIYRFLRAKNAHCLVVEDRETHRVEGFLIVSWRKGCAVGYVQTIDVHPDAQGNGLGRMLIETAERVMAERGLTKSILQVYLRNNPALALYLKEGYTIRRVRTRYYANSFRGARDAIEMVKELAPLPPTSLTSPPPAEATAPLTVASPPQSQVSAMGVVPHEVAAVADSPPRAERSMGALAFESP